MRILLEEASLAARSAKEERRDTSNGHDQPSFAEIFGSSRKSQGRPSLLLDVGFQFNDFRSFPFDRDWPMHFP
jgi:hypothetical protein